MHDRPTILLVTEDRDLEEALLAALRGPEGRQLVSGGIRKGLKLLAQGGADLLLLDGALPEEGVARLVRAARASDRDMHVFLLTDAGRPPAGLEVDGVFGRPPDAGRLRDLVARAEGRWKFMHDCRLLGRSDRMREVREKVAQLAPTDVIVLITGESGTGKSVVADALHRYSRRADRPFLVVNCGAIPETLLESELFGHERGAFTDARSQRKGIFEAADGGTVFLDEIGEMTLPAQVRLLHVIEEREVTRLGSAHAIPVDVRVLAATNRDLGLAVQRGEFRRDLYYRLDVVEIRMPALRERPEDIPELVEAFAEDCARAHGIPRPAFEPGALEVLGRHTWPGNIRELRNLVERLIVLSRGTTLTEADILRHLNVAEETFASSRNLPVPLHKTPDQAHLDLIYWALLDLKKDVAELKASLGGVRPAPGAVSSYPGPVAPLVGGEVRVEEAAVAEPVDGDEGEGALKSLTELEREYIDRVLRTVGGHRKQAAEILGIGERTLYRKIREYHL